MNINTQFLDSADVRFFCHSAGRLAAFYKGIKLGVMLRYFHCFSRNVVLWGDREAAGI